MSRLPGVTRESLTPEGRSIWDGIAAVRPGVRGPYGVLMHAPELAKRVANLEDYFRFNAELPETDRELVILATARELEARFAWARHEARGLQVGTRKEAIEAVRSKSDLKSLEPRERLLVEIVRSLLLKRSLPDGLFDHGMKELGRQQLLEIVALTGHYSLIGLIINGFNVSLPEDTATF